MSSKDSKAFDLGGRTVGAGAPALLIAEIAQAHDGSLGFAHSFIDLAADAGADAIKFQTHIADAETTPLEEFRINFSYEDPTRFDYWRRMEFTAEQWAGLAEHAARRGLIFLSSPFSLEACELLERLQMPAWKIASGEVSNQPMMEWMCRTGKPVLISSGMSDLDETRRAVGFVSQRGCGVGVFQCTSKYPTPLEEVGLNLLDDYAREFRCPVGLSDHSGSPYPALAAMARGADMLELHLCFHKTQFGPDTVASLDPAQFRLVAEARDAFHIMASAPVEKNKAAEGLSGLRRLFTKSLALRRTCPAGTTLTPELLTMKKPGTGIPANRYDDFIGRVLVREVSHRELLSEADLLPPAGHANPTR